MGNLLTAISGQFAKLVIQGTMFPVLIVSGLNLIFVAPLLPFGVALQERIKRIALGEASWSIVALTFAVLVATGLLYNLNIAIIRLYEGYPWRRSKLGALFIARRANLLSRAASLRLAFRHISRLLRKQDLGHPLLGDLSEQQRTLANLVNDAFPDRTDLVMPTRLGNVIRAFERYPSVAYRMDAIVIWPRLVAEMDAGFAATVDESKTAFDFMINCSFLSAVTALMVSVMWLRDDSAVLSSSSVGWLRCIGLFAVLALLFYQASIGAAEQWGAQVRSAFDLYRGKLLKSLGYERHPGSLTEERALWHRISVGLLFPDSRDTSMSFTDEPTQVIVDPPEVQLTVGRSLVSRPWDIVEVTVTLVNEDPFQKNADEVSLVETIPDGYHYVHDSISCTVATATVVSTPVGTAHLVNLKPLELNIGEIAVGATVKVNYRIKAGSGS